ncbi:MAG: RpiB/LacA/LacB family sugar-phosphate isomerase [Spirochaetes bacterium]|nr:RpiB/LacA/LacB family sugar-phosphate isomerase [Spirochaetota bacterium]
MKIAVINETSAADKNKDIMAALEGRGHDIINAGMTQTGVQPELTYIQTGFMAALLIATKRVDLIVGGCGTGQGFLNAVMQYPGVVCGHIITPLDAWLFAQINAGNCISLALNQGYGWASEQNLKFIFDAFFSVESGCGYPEHRKESQMKSRQLLTSISCMTHKSMAYIVQVLPDEIVKPVISYPGFADILNVETLADEQLKNALQSRM